MRLLLALILAIFTGRAAADELRPGFIEMRQVGGAHWQLDWKQPLARPGEARLVLPSIPANCRMIDGPHSRLAPLALVGSAKLACKGTVKGRRMGYREILGGGDVLLRIAPLGERVQNYRLTPQLPAIEIEAAASTAQVWRTYGRLGVVHILTGWDHLLFVIALVLLVQRGWAAAKAVTAFTLAHSLTLAGVTLGFVGLNDRAVEALIALSIVFVAVEIVKPRKSGLTARFPWIVAFGFGLVHGFGFAGALREVGLPDGEVPSALLAFNLGVEAGQLAVVIGVLALVAALRRSSPTRLPQTIRVAGYGIGITASYWLIERLVA